MLVEYVTGGSVARKAVVHDRFVESSSSTKRGSFVPAVRNSCPAWRLTRSLEFIAGWNSFLLSLRTSFSHQNGNCIFQTTNLRVLDAI